MQQDWKKSEIYTESWLENLKGRYDVGNVGIWLD